mmetsp:Transcript_37007/g.89221  ORF Transcript_37007/g.89221 Transcript_37007/m.89221 type:complete len:95 (-) Transcript_37007:5-289(-)
MKKSKGGSDHHHLRPTRINLLPRIEMIAFFRPATKISLSSIVEMTILRTEEWNGGIAALQCLCQGSAQKRNNLSPFRHRIFSDAYLAVSLPKTS